ncbi:MAG: YjcZ family sporulation protein [Bacilli bacterium]
MNTGSTFAIILVLFILLVIVGCGGWFTSCGF